MLLHVYSQILSPYSFASRTLTDLQGDIDGCMHSKGAAPYPKKDIGPIYSPQSAKCYTLNAQVPKYAVYTQNHHDDSEYRSHKDSTFGHFRPLGIEVHTHKLSSNTNASWKFPKIWGPTVDTKIVEFL